jgi:hypothetical protein
MLGPATACKCYRSSCIRAHTHTRHSTCDTRRTLAMPSECIAATSRKDPLTASLHELIQHHAHIRQHEATDIEREKLRRVAHAEFETHMRLGRVLQTRVFGLASDLICTIGTSARTAAYTREDHIYVPRTCTASHSRANAAIYCA